MNGRIGLFLHLFTIHCLIIFTRIHYQHLPIQQLLQHQVSYMSTWITILSYLYTGCPEGPVTTLFFDKNFKNHFKNMFNISKCISYKRLFFPKNYLKLTIKMQSCLLSLIYCYLSLSKIFIMR